MGAPQPQPNYRPTVRRYRELEREARSAVPSKVIENIYRRAPNVRLERLRSRPAGRFSIPNDYISHEMVERLLIQRGSKTREVAHTAHRFAMEGETQSRLLRAKLRDLRGGLVKANQRETRDRLRRLSTKVMSKIKF